MKKKVLAGIASLTLLDIAAATAATPVVYNWTGFYVGAHAGYRWADPDFSSNPYLAQSLFGPPPGAPVPIPARNDGFSLNGGLIGIHGGYNHQFSPSLLLGIEGDWTWGSGKDTISRAFNAVSTDGFITYSYSRSSTVELDWQASIRARAGWVNGPWLLFLTAGVAFAHVEWADTDRLAVLLPSRTTSASASKTLTGFVGGGGVEYMLAPNWLGRVEYLFEHFGDVTVPHGFGPQFGTLDIGTVHKLRVGISYRFGGAPLFARN